MKKIDEMILSDNKAICDNIDDLKFTILQFLEFVNIHTFKEKYESIIFDFFHYITYQIHMENKVHIFHFYTEA